MNRKAKGTKGERELVKFFNENNWSCIRIAGSGSSRYPSPDVLAGNAIRRLAIECKVTKDNKKYISKQEIEQLQTFSHKFGAESWIGVKFQGEQWYFLMIEDFVRNRALPQNFEKLKTNSTAVFWLVVRTEARVAG